MEVIVKKNYEEMSKAAATLFAAEIMENPKTILGMATGSTPVGLYKELVKMYEAGDLDFSQMRIEFITVGSTLITEGIERNICCPI